MWCSCCLRGADVNAGSYGSALEAASCKGHEQVAQRLLESGADIDVEGRYGGALQAALYKGHDQVVQLLLEKRASVRSPSTSCSSLT